MNVHHILIDISIIVLFEWVTPEIKMKILSNLFGVNKKKIKKKLYVKINYVTYTHSSVVYIYKKNCTELYGFLIGFIL